MKKYVITGGPSCGKTTLINKLSGYGHCVINEAARDVLTDSPDLTVVDREYEIFLRQLERENRTYDAPRIFLDRGLLDVHAYSQLLLGYIPKGILCHSMSNHYDAIFVLDRLPFKNDGVRIEKDDAEAQRIHDLLIATYQNHGYTPIPVPAFEGDIEMSVRKRADFILKRVR